MMRKCRIIITLQHIALSMALGLLLVRHTSALYTEIGGDLTLSRAAGGDLEHHLIQRICCEVHAVV